MPLPRFPSLVLLALVPLCSSADPFGPPVKLTSSTASRVSVAYVGERVLALWVRDGVVRAKATDLEGDGSVLAESVAHAAIAAIGHRALAVWTLGSGEVMAVRLTGDGVPVGAAVRIGSHAAGPVAVAASVDRYLVAWDSPLEQIYTTLLNSSVEIQVPAMVASNLSGADIGEPVAASNGSGFAVAWHTWPPDEKVFVLTFEASGIQSTIEPLLVSEAALYPDVTSNGTGYFIAWGNRDVGGGIRGRTLTSSQEPGRRVIVSSDNGVVPRIAWDGSAYSVVYVRSTHSPRYTFVYLYAMRFRESGGFVEHLGVSSVFYSTGLDLIARSGRVDLIGGNQAGVNWQTAVVHSPPPDRRRGVRP